MNMIEKYNGKFRMYLQIQPIPDKIKSTMTNNIKYLNILIRSRDLLTKHSTHTTCIMAQKPKCGECLIIKCLG